MFSGILTGAAGSIGGGLLGLIGQRSANRTNIQLHQSAFDQNKQMWHLQNEYNTPMAQMQRLQEAGLNPNLIYSSMGQHTAGHAPQMQPAKVENELTPMQQAIQVMPLMSQYQDIEFKKAQTNNVEAQNAVIGQQLNQLKLRNLLSAKELDNYDALTKGKLSALQARTALTRWQQTRSANLFNLEKRLMSERINELVSLLPHRENLMRSQFSHLLGQTKALSLSNELNERLLPLGATSNDPLGLRLGLIELQKLGLDPNESLVDQAGDVISDAIGKTIKKPFTKIKDWWRDFFKSETWNVREQKRKKFNLNK